MSIEQQAVADVLEKLKTEGDAVARKTAKEWQRDHNVNEVRVMQIAREQRAQQIGRKNPK
jgi:histidinol dehydrogenase